jgi:hypothetical protein
LRDELFEDGIVEYVDRGSRSHLAIILLRDFASRAQRGERDRRRCAVAADLIIGSAEN